MARVQLPDNTGVLLINLGTPDSPNTGDVRRYLREFLLDPRVIDIPALQRNLLVRGIILPFRPKASAKAYRKIWTNRGSPLLYHGQDLATKLSSFFGGQAPVEVGMRYGYCLNETDCCGRIVRENRNCYRAQSFATARALAVPPWPMPPSAGSPPRSLTRQPTRSAPH